jgi:hypothetical protein
MIFAAVVVVAAVCFCGLKFYAVMTAFFFIYFISYRIHKRAV